MTIVALCNSAWCVGVVFTGVKATGWPHGYRQNTESAVCVVTLCLHRRWKRPRDRVLFTGVKIADISGLRSWRVTPDPDLWTARHRVFTHVKTLRTSWFSPLCLNAGGLSIHVNSATRFRSQVLAAGGATGRMDVSARGFHVGGSEARILFSL